MSEPRVYVLKSGYSAGLMDGPKTDYANPDVTLVHKDDYDALKAENEKLRKVLLPILEIAEHEAGEDFEVCSEARAALNDGEK